MHCILNTYDILHTQEIVRTVQYCTSLCRGSTIMHSTSIVLYTYVCILYIYTVCIHMVIHRDCTYDIIYHTYIYVQTNPRIITYVRTYFTMTCIISYYHMNIYNWRLQAHERQSCILYSLISTLLHRGLCQYADLRNFRTERLAIIIVLCIPAKNCYFIHHHIIRTIYTKLDYHTVCTYDIICCEP